MMKIKIYALGEAAKILLLLGFLYLGYVLFY